MPPPALSEETLMAPEHNEILAKLKYISVLVDKIIEVARHKGNLITNNEIDFLLLFPLHIEPFSSKFALKIQIL